MKTLLKFLISAASLLLISPFILAQAPTLGTAANFVLFSGNGAVSQTGLSQLTGDVGSNNGSSTNFGNVNGNMHDQNPASAQASTDLLTAYNQLAAVTAQFFVASPLGNGDTLIAGVYSLGAASTLNGILTLDAQNNPSAVFIIRVMGSLSSAANTKVNLINGAQACRVYWQIEGLLSIASGSVLRGTFIVNNAAISMSSNDTVEGRLLTTSGAITADNLLAYTPIGCGSPVLTGPTAPTLGAVGCFGVFSAVGDVTNAGVSFIRGDVGTQIGSTTGFDTLNITGKLHLVQDTTTAAAAAALGTAYTTLSTLSHDIQLMAPAAFGNNLVLTPHTYLLNAMTVFTDSLYLNAMGDSNAVFVIKINGALSTSTYAKVILKNEARSRNVYWLVNGAVAINDYSEFKGTIIASNGAVDAKIGVQVQGRLLTTAGAITTAAVTVTSPVVCLAPASVVITQEPANLQVCVGDTARFVVAATGNNLNYQWYRNNVLLTNTGSISGATNDTLIIFPANLASAGNFSVIVSAASLADTSVLALLTVNPNTSITTEPSSLLVCSGDSVIFSVIAQGSGLTYQWYRGTTALINSFFLSGADSSVLSFFAASLSQVDSNYYVVVTGVCGVADTSVRVSLRIDSVPQVATQPLSQSICNGDTVRFSITTTTASAQVQWYRGSSLLSNSLNLVGADSTVLTILAANPSDAAANYYAVVSGTCGLPDTSDFAALTVNLITTITTEPVNTTLCEGQHLNLSVVATGAGLTYQWFRGAVALTNTAGISGATTDTLSIANATTLYAGTNYYVVVSGLCGADTSAFTTVQINSGTQITNQPLAQTACLGQPAAFTVLATGNSLTYQWRKGTVHLVDGGTISGATGSTLGISAVGLADMDANYNVIVNSICGLADTSDMVALTVNALNAITTEPIQQTVCVGQTVNLSVVAAGVGLTYQWRIGSTPLQDGGLISGATTASLNISAAVLGSAASNYNVIVNGLCGAPDTSVSVAVVVNTAPSITTQPITQTACVGANASFTVVASGSAVIYQWRKGLVNLTNAGNISGVNTATLNLTGISLADAATDYNVLISGSCSPAVASANVALLVNTLVQITTSPMASQTQCVGSSVSFAVVATGTNLTYQWRRGNVALANGGNVSGATSATLLLNPVLASDAASTYNVIVSGLCGAPDTSVSVAVVVNTAPSITTQPITQTACVGANASFTVVASGSAVIYQWRKGLVNLTNAGNISGVNTATLSLTGISLADAATDYNVLISGSCSPAVASANVALLVNTLVQITTSPMASQTQCVGGSVSFAVVATGTNLTYQWRRGNVALANGGNVSGATSATLLLNPVLASDAASDYNVVVSGVCTPAQISANAALVVNALTAFVNQPVTISACEGSSASLTATAVGTGLTYQWFKGAVALVNGGNISGSTTNTLLINPVSLSDAATNYRLVVTGSCLPALSSNLVAVEVDLPHLIVTQPADTITHIGGSASFTVVDNGQALTYQWRRGTTLVVDGGNISGSQSATLQFSPATVADNGMNYNVVISGNCAPDLRSINVALLVTEPLGLGELMAKDAPVLFYPNPFRQELNAVIEANSALRSADLDLYNSLGILVLQYRLTAEHPMRETMALPAGLYQYRITSEGQLVQTGKLVAIQ